MAAGEASARLLERLEATLAAWAADRDEAAFAFSGGLACLVVAGLLRKRLDLDCVVVGVAGAPDFEAADRAAEYLDYRVRKVKLTDARLLSVARTCARGVRGPAASLLPLVPLTAAGQAAPGRACVAGWGWRAANPGAPQPGPPCHSPLAELSRGRGIPRRELQAMARRIGLPEAFVRVRPRPPAAGSGIGIALHRAAEVRGEPLRALLADRRARPGA